MSDRRTHQPSKRSTQPSSQPGRDKRRWWALVGGGVLVVAVGAIVALSSGATTEEPRTQPTRSSAEIGSLPGPIAANAREANQVISTSLSDKLEALRGVPVVVNMWASWCGSCRQEFPYFQQSARQWQKKVAFVGLNSRDDRSAAEAFLADYPVDYPSVEDPDASQAIDLGAPGWPTTVFFDREGRKTHVRPGGYPSLEALNADVRRYALG